MAHSLRLFIHYIGLVIIHCLFSAHAAIWHGLRETEEALYWVSGGALGHNVQVLTGKWNKKHTHIHMHTHIHTHTHTYTHAHTHIHTHTHTFAHILNHTAPACVHVCSNINMHHIINVHLPKCYSAYTYTIRYRPSRSTQPNSVLIKTLLLFSD